MRGSTIVLWAFCASKSQAVDVFDEEDCSVATRTIGQITKLEYAFASENTTSLLEQPAEATSGLDSENSLLSSLLSMELTVPSTGLAETSTTSTSSAGCSHAPEVDDFACHRCQAPGAGSIALESLKKKRSVANIFACIDECMGNSACMGASYQKGTRNCILFQLITGLAALSGYDTYIKTAAVAVTTTTTTTKRTTTTTTTGRTSTSTTKTTTTSKTTPKQSGTTQVSTSRTTTKPTTIGGSTTSARTSSQPRSSSLTSSSPSASPTVPSCGFTGYDTGTNIGYYADASLATYFGCSSLCNANAACLSFAINPSAPACILYEHDLSVDLYSASSPNTFYLRGGFCPPATTTTTTSYSPTPTGKFPYCPAGLSPYNVTQVTAGTQQPYTPCIAGKSASACMHDIDGNNYCNDCISCLNGWACASDADCPAGYACIVGSDCPGNGTTGVAMCLYMLYNPAYNCYAAA